MKISPKILIIVFGVLFGITSLSPSTPVIPLAHALSLYECSLKSAFEGTFVAKGNTETEAKNKVIKACEKKSEPMFCNHDDVKCSSKIAEGGKILKDVKKIFKNSEQEESDEDLEKDSE